MVTLKDSFRNSKNLPVVTPTDISSFTTTGFTENFVRQSFQRFFTGRYSTHFTGIPTKKNKVSVRNHFTKPSRGYLEEISKEILVKIFCNDFKDFFRRSSRVPCRFFLYMCLRITHQVLPGIYSNVCASGLL